MTDSILLPSLPKSGYKIPSMADFLHMYSTYEGFNLKKIPKYNSNKYDFNDTKYFLRSFIMEEG